MSERTNRIAWTRLDLPEPFAPTANESTDEQTAEWGSSQRRGRTPRRRGKGRDLNEILKRRASGKRRERGGERSGAHSAARRTDAIKMGLEVHRGLLAVGLEALDDHLFDVHGASAVRGRGAKKHAPSVPLRVYGRSPDRGTAELLGARVRDFREDRRETRAVHWRSARRSRALRSDTPRRESAQEVRKINP